MHHNTTDFYLAVVFSFKIFLVHKIREKIKNLFFLGLEPVRALKKYIKKLAKVHEKKAGK